MTMPRIPLTRRTVKTWADLETYAEDRARRSIRRNDPIAWAYWKGAEAWAQEAPGWLSDPHDWPAAAESYVRSALVNREVDPTAAARSYSKAKWLRILDQNNGRKAVKPLSLGWLKELA